MQHITDKLILREILDIYKELQNNEDSPAMMKYYGGDKLPKITGSWERKMNPDASGQEVLGLIVLRYLRHRQEALDARRALDVPNEMWKTRFDHCVREMRDQRKESDILNKDIAMRELILYHGGGEQGETD